MNSVNNTKRKETSIDLNKETSLYGSCSIKKVEEYGCYVYCRSGILPQSEIYRLFQAAKEQK